MINTKVKTLFDEVQPFSQMVQVGAIMGNKVYIQFNDVQDEEDAIFQYRLVASILAKAFESRK